MQILLADLYAGSACEVRKQSSGKKRIGFSAPNVCMLTSSGSKQPHHNDKSLHATLASIFQICMRICKKLQICGYAYLPRKF